MQILAIPISKKQVLLSVHNNFDRKSYIYEQTQ